MYWTLPRKAREAYKRVLDHLDHGRLFGAPVMHFTKTACQTSSAFLPAPTHCEAQAWALESGSWSLFCSLSYTSPAAFLWRFFYLLHSLNSRSARGFWCCFSPSWWLFVFQAESQCHQKYFFKTLIRSQSANSHIDTGCLNMIFLLLPSLKWP